MKTIRNQKLFQELQNKPQWGTLFEGPPWDPQPKEPTIPCFFGGLDHIRVTRNGIYFYDRGSNGRDNSFVIRPLLAEKGPE
jgi:hypothetical protein